MSEEGRREKGEGWRVEGGGRMNKNVYQKSIYIFETDIQPRRLFIERKGWIK